MHLFYVDEVKHHPPEQPFYWLCALAFPEKSIKDVDERLARLAAEYFGTAILDASNEFHGVQILHGKGPYKGKLLAGRIDLYKRLLDAIAETEGLGRIEIRADPEKVIASSYKDKAFMFLVEKVDEFMKKEKSLALLIADDDKEIAGANVASLSGYKARGTQYQFGRPINLVVDTIHHTQSHHSRLLQLADIYVYTRAMMAGDCTKHPRNEIAAHARTKDVLRFPSKYKHWPTDDSWYKR